jgi:hypothetical protein
MSKVLRQSERNKMATRKSANRKHAKDTLLNTVARTLGHAAGTFTKTTMELAEKISAGAENVLEDTRQKADNLRSRNSPSRSQPAKKKSVRRTSASHSSSKLKTKPTRAAKRQPTKMKSTRRKRGAASKLQ